MRNFFLIDRGLYDHPLFSNEPFSKRDAWGWMISAACYKPTKVLIKGSIYTLQRGQFSHSIRFLAEKWEWDKNRIERFFSVLKTETMIETGSETGQLIVTICNYDKYQTLGFPSETASGTEIETAAGQHRDKEEYSNTDKEKKDPPSGYSPEFDQFWFSWPKHRRAEKPKAYSEWKKSIKLASPNEIYTGAQRYYLSDDVVRGYACYPAKWLKGQRWSEEYEMAKPKKASFNI